MWVPPRVITVLLNAKNTDILRGKSDLKKQMTGRLLYQDFEDKFSPETALKIREMQKMMREKKQLKHREETIVSHNFH